MLIPYNQLSEEQKNVIRRISRENSNLFVEGPPGSGKTLISLYTLRDIVQESNIKPLLMMYNHSLYGYLKKALNSLGINDNITIVTKDKYFWDLGKDNNIYPNWDDSYDEKYDYILGQLLNKNLNKNFDVIIVDEVQDINIKEWELIKKLGKRILTLGDFDQGLYNTNISKDAFTNIGTFEKLTAIFRFHKNIAKLANLFSKKKEDLVSKVKVDSSISPMIFDVDTPRDEFFKIKEILIDLKHKSKRTAVICPDREKIEELEAFLNSSNIECIYFRKNIDFRNHNFASTTPLLITSFSAKGLEFENVILFGFDKDNSQILNLKTKNILSDVIYVSITRTNENLYIVRNNQTIDEIKQIKVDNDKSSSTLSLDDIF